MKLRPASSRDRASIESLIFPILRSYGLEPSPESTDADLKDIESHYSENGGSFDVLVNDDDDEILGTVAVHRTTRELCELRKMYLAPAVRGQGWGRRLLEHALLRAGELGYSEIWLETASVLTEAHRLYESYGFRTFEGPHCSDRCDFAMIRSL